MRVTADTNVLVGAIVRDDPDQARAAAQVLTEAELIAVAMARLCEFVWVLRRVYGFQADDVARAIRALLAAKDVEVNRPAAEARLSLLETGGDFADGVIAHEGRWLGGETFVSFDRAAMSLLTARGESARLL